MNPKAALRREMGLLLDGAAPGELAANSALIREAILCSSLWTRARSVCLFAALAAEPNLDALLEEGVRAGKAVFYPRVHGLDLELLAVSGPASFEIVRWKLREPIRESSHAESPAAIDLILIPGLAFSRSGARLGRGGGFYDRLLSTIPDHPGRAGVCFQKQIRDDIPVEPHDRGVGFIFTETGLEDCGAP